MPHNNGFGPAPAPAPAGGVSTAIDPESKTPVPSPCISVCVMQEGLCKGCLRTIDEIAHWGKGGDAYRRDVWARIREREERVVAP